MLHRMHLRPFPVRGEELVDLYDGDVGEVKTDKLSPEVNHCVVQAVCSLSLMRETSSLTSSEGGVFEDEIPEAASLRRSTRENANQHSKMFRLARSVLDQ